MKESYGVLNDQNATADELARAFVSFEQCELTLIGEAEKIRARVIDLQTQLMAGATQDVSKALKSAKIELEDVMLQAEACRDAQTKLKERLGTKILQEKQERVAEIEKEWNRLETERVALFREFLRQAAKAAVLLEQASSREPYVHGTEIRFRTPVPKIDFDLLDQQEAIFYREEVAQARKGATPMPGIRDRQHDLSEERYRVEKSIEGYDSEKAVREALKATGSKQFPDPVPEAPRMTPHIPHGTPLEYRETFRNEEERDRVLAGQKPPAHPENSVGSTVR